MLPRNLWGVLRGEGDRTRHLGFIRDGKAARLTRPPQAGPATNNSGIDDGYDEVLGSTTMGTQEEAAA